MPPAKGDNDGDKGGDRGLERNDTDPAVADTHSSDPAPQPSLVRSTSGSARAPEATTGKAKRQVRPGDVLGRYELGDEVGEGGMATVYRARDRELRRDVAIKVLFPHLARRDEIVRRFHREARAAAGLEHPNILRVYDVGGGEVDDPPYIVMELIRGRTLLAEIEQRGPMLAEVAACIGALLADALAAAHAAGIIHRDIKPANVLIAPEGRLLLADFGVARLETEDSLVTRTGSLLGTPAYMSPEQAGGDTATAKSDLYSLGATLYQLATGSLPYTGSAARVMTQIAQGALVAPVRKRAAVGPELSRAIERLMAVDASERPASAVVVGNELRAIATAGGLGEPKAELAAYFSDPDAFVRARTPAIVTALVAAATAAIDQAKLPRAMALVDRASALAPNDPAVTALVVKVTEGGRSTQRRRMFAVAGLGVLCAGGAVAGVMKLRGGSDHAIDAPLIAVAEAGPPDGPSLAVTPEDAATSLVDAGVGRDASVRVRHVDAALAVTMSLDGAATPQDAPVVLDAAATEAMGAILVKNDTWCEVSIDGVGQGRRSDHPIRTTAGHHKVRCEQPGTKRVWTTDVEVAANATATASGSLLGMVDVRLDIDATIAGVPHRRGDVVSLPPGGVDIVAGTTKKHITLSAACTIRGADDELGCYR